MRILNTLILLLAASLAVAAIAVAQELPAADSSAASSTADSLLPRLVPIPLVGSVDRGLDSAWVISSEALQFADYRTLADLLGRLPGAFVRELASPGLGTGLTFRGAPQQSIAVLADGIPLNDPLTGAFNLALYPTEQIERIEVIPPTRAFLYETNGAGGLVNLVSKSKKALVPQSRIRYSEGAHGYGFIDGTVSQDIIRGLNVTAGAQHATFDKRFQNSGYDAWTTHVKARYNASNSLNLFASVLVNGTELGLNGGVSPATPDSSRFDELVAAVVNTDAYEKLTRTDLQAGVAVRPGFDSSGIHTLTFFHSSALREYRDEENHAIPNGIYVASDHRTEWFGARWIHERTLAGQSLQLGAEVVSRAVVASPTTGGHRQTVTSGFGLLTLRPTDGLSASGYGRIEDAGDGAKVSFGADVALGCVEGLQIVAGASRSYRYPTFQERYWTDALYSPQGFSDPERHDLIEAGVRHRAGSTQASLTLFRRVVRHAIVTRVDIEEFLYAAPNGREEATGMSLGLSQRAGWLLFEGRLEELDRGRELTAGLPDWWAECGAYFHDSLVGGHLLLKTGLRGVARSGFTPNTYDEERLVFGAGGAERSGPAGQLDFVLIGRIGDATIHLLWENLLDRHQVTTFLYPMEGRNFRFGVNWDFLN
jgi:outer membrane cobalamin receptor